MATSIANFTTLAREAVAALGLTPVDNFVTIAPDVDAVIVRAWVRVGETFVKLYVDHEIVLIANGDEKARKAVRDLLKYDLERCRPLRVEYLR